jgi:hypothetical protein
VSLLETKATVTLEYGDMRVAGAVAAALAPDNLRVPVGLKVKSVREGDAVVTEIIGEVGFATFVATVDDLLFCASTAEKALKVVQN